MPPAPGPSWRGSDKKQSKDNRSWRRPGSGAAPTWTLRSSIFRYFFGLLFAVVSALAIGTFIFLIFVPGCQQTRFAVLVPAPYRDGGLPPHPFAQQDREEFRSKYSVENLSERLAPAPTSTGSTKRTLKSSSSRETLVMYVSALAGHTEAGVVIYSIESGPDEPEDYLPLDRLWTYLAGLPKDQKKVLAIDLARGPVDWRWGQFVQAELGLSGDPQKPASEFDTALEKIPNLAILTSAAPGEISWVNTTLSRSIFLHYLMRGLNGEADGVTGRPKDRRITLDEIHRFVLQNTNHWVEQNRDLRGQHPQLLTSNESKATLLETVVTESLSNKAASASTEPAKGVDGARIKQLETLWEARDKWAARQPEQRFPLVWRQFREHVRRAEQWWLSGQKEGMDPHLLAAEKAEKDLASAENSRNTETDSSSFVGANLTRRAGNFAVVETQPPLPERPLQAAYKEFAPTSLTKPMQDEILKLRTRAEQQTWQSFRSHRWAGKLLEDADRDRRLSEDLTFVGTSAELDRAAQLRRSAVEKLQQFEEIQKQLAEAHKLHSQLLSDLPDLAWWAAQRMPVENLRAGAHQSRRARLMNEYSQGIDETRFRPPSLADQDKLREELDDSNLQQTEIDLLLLFEQTRQLAKLLDRELEPDSSYLAQTAWRQELQALTQALTNPERGLAALKSRLTRHASGLIGGVANEAGKGAELGQTQYFHWVRLRNVLEWSGLPADLMRGLFTELDQSDRILDRNAQKTPVAAAAEWDGNDWAGVTGCWQALWALQSLSLGAADGTMHERWVNWKNAVVDAKKRLGLLMTLGQSVRRELRERVDRALPTPAASDRIEDVLRTLIVADRATRTLHGYDAALFPTNRDPTKRLLDFDLGALCIVQADRYLEDFWGKINPNDPDPWFVLATDQCLKVASRQNDLLSIEALNTARSDGARRLQVRQNARVKIASVDAAVDLSLATQRNIRATAEFDERVPPGVAALWFTEDADPSTSLFDFQPVGRQSVSTSDPTADITIRKLRTPPPAKCGEIAVHPRLLFRGRYWDESAIVVNPCPPNSIDWEYKAAPSLGEVVVYGVDRRDTIFILDCSSSMSDSMDPKKKGGTTRFQAARDALADAIRVLRDGPVARNEKEPHVVGLMAYGHRTKAKNGDPTKTATNDNWTSPIPPTVAEDWRNDFEILNQPDRLLDDQYRRIIGNLEKLQPFGQTPLLGSILSSARTLVERKRGGVIVAITDGAYNDERKDGPRYRALKELLQNHPELSFHLVAFGLDKESEIDTLRELAKAARGTYHDAPNGTALAEAIEKVMKPRPYSVIREAQPREEHSAGLGEIVRRLSPHTYKVGFPELAPFPATIEGGERLEFDLDFGSHALKHRRPQPLLFRRIQDSAGVSPQEPTRFGYLKADYDRTSATADFLFSFDRDDLLGIISRPVEIEFSISPRGSRQQFSRTWGLAVDQSIPVWRVTLRDWPADGRPVVTTSWKMTRTEPDLQISLAELLKAPKASQLPGWPERGLAITAEQQPGKILVRLQTDEKQAEQLVADVRVELGNQSQIENRFLPKPFDWRRKLYESQNQATFEFEIGENFDKSDVIIALTARSSLERGSRTIESPLLIEKWDKEQ